MSPLLFNLAADCLAKMVQTAQQNGDSRIYPHGLAILRYADDTIICVEDDAETTQNMKIRLYIYGKMSGLKINFDKSELLMTYVDDEKIIMYADLFNCAVGQWPIKYLGVPVAGSRLHVKDWVMLHEKILKKLAGWQCSSLFAGGKLILIDACLSNIPAYAMSMYLIPKTVVKKILIEKGKILLARWSC